MSPCNILIADDHPLIRAGLRRTFKAIDSKLQIIEAGSSAEIAEILAADAKIDLLVLDLRMPGSRGLSNFISAYGSQIDIPIVVLSASEDPIVIHLCKHFGAKAYIPKSTPTSTLRHALKNILQGLTWFPKYMSEPDIDNDKILNPVANLTSLTPQQMRTLLLLCNGHLNKQIAFELSITEATVKAHVSAILSKLKVQSRTQAIIEIDRIAMQPELAVAA